MHFCSAAFFIRPHHSCAVGRQMASHYMQGFGGGVGVWGLGCESERLGGARTPRRTEQRFPSASRSGSSRRGGGAAGWLGRLKLSHNRAGRRRRRGLGQGARRVGAVDLVLVRLERWTTALMSAKDAAILVLVGGETHIHTYRVGTLDTRVLLLREGTRYVGRGFVL